MQKEEQRAENVDFLRNGIGSKFGAQSQAILHAKIDAESFWDQEAVLFAGEEADGLMFGQKEEALEENAEEKQKTAWNQGDMQTLRFQKKEEARRQKDGQRMPAQVVERALGISKAKEEVGSVSRQEVRQLSTEDVYWNKKMEEAEENPRVMEPGRVEALTVDTVLEELERRLWEERTASRQSVDML